MKKFVVAIVAAFALMFTAAPAGAVAGDAGYSPNIVTRTEYDNVRPGFSKWKTEAIFDLGGYCINHTSYMVCLYPNKNDRFGIRIEYDRNSNGGWILDLKAWS